MAKRKGREEELRKIGIMYMDAASKLSKGNTLFVPVSSYKERIYHISFCNNFVNEMKSAFPESVYDGLKATGKKKYGIHYLCITRTIKKDIMYIQDSVKRNKILQISLTPRKTRERTIRLLLGDGYPISEVESVLGASITLKEKEILNHFKKLFEKKV